MLRKNLATIHFVLLAIAIVNFFSRLLIGIGLHVLVALYVKIGFCVAGAFLFWMYVKPFKAVAIYYGVYFFAPILMAVAFQVGGILSAVLLSIAVFIISEPTKPLVKSGNYVVYTKFGGFFSSCCSYDIYENKWSIFQKHRATFRGDYPAIKEQGFTVRNDTAYLRVTMPRYNVALKRTVYVDSTIAIQLK